ncbi:hypothetical protein FRB99_006525 [Tulasnella sp. 403]|nr:hypothetical protein FRB99_006525 [Tulasnella sp. 403]
MFAQNLGTIASPFTSKPTTPRADCLSKDVTSIPQEILSSIFEHAYHRDGSCMHSAGRVSKLWREVALGTPTLWSDIHVSSPSDPERTRMQLARAGATPLHIDFSDDSLTRGACMEFLSLLSTKSERWTSFRIMRFDAKALLASPLFPSVLPRLRHLDIRGANSSLPAGHLQFPKSLPALESLYVSGVSVEWEGVRLPSLEKLELKEASLGPPDLPQFLDMLDASQDLVHLVLVKIWDEDAGLMDRFKAPRQITLPRLEHLEVHEPPSSHVFAWVLTPNLVTLVAKKSYWLRYWALVDIHFPSLDKLVLLDFSNSTSAIRNFLRASPNISTLDIRHTNIMEPFGLVPDLVLQELDLLRLRNLTIHGVFSLGQVKKVALKYMETLERVRVHCLDLGLAFGSMREEYVEHDDALAWLESVPSFYFGVDHTSKCYGTRYRSLDDCRRGYRIACSSACLEPSTGC